MKDNKLRNARGVDVVKPKIDGWIEAGYTVYNIPPSYLKFFEGERIFFSTDEGMVSLNAKRL